jgi:hypothetical protein
MMMTLGFAGVAQPEGAAPQHAHHWFEKRL